jgi:cytochrome c oxidase subunit 2
VRRICKSLLLVPLMLLASCATEQSTNNPHGPAARSLAHLSIAMTVVFLIATAAMWVLLAIAVAKGRGSLKEHMPIDIGGGQGWIAIGGLAIPLIVLTVFFFLGIQLLADFPIHGKHGAMQGASVPKPDILVVGHQWWWEVHYLTGSADQHFTSANEIHIPAHRPVNIEIESGDVMHSFWVPSLHGKVDAVPGHPNFIRIEASDPGQYTGQCAEYCGEQHAHMRLLLVAQEPAEFNAWLEQHRRPGATPTTPEAIAGEQVFLAGPCSKCHTVRGTLARGKFAPDLTHVGSRKYIGANSFDNNEAYMESWITHAQSLKPGCKMPDLRQFSGIQLRELAAYLHQLQ